MIRSFAFVLAEVRMPHQTRVVAPGPDARSVRAADGQLLRAPAAYRTLFQTSPRPLSGAFTMLAYGLGTGIALLAVGMASSLAGVRLTGNWTTRFAAASIMIAGIVLLYRGLAAPHCHG